MPCKCTIASFKDVENQQDIMKNVKQRNILEKLVKSLKNEGTLVVSKQKVYTEMNLLLLVFDDFLFILYTYHIIKQKINGSMPSM